MNVRFVSIASALVFVFSIGCNQQPAPQQDATLGEATSPAAGGAEPLPNPRDGQSAGTMAGNRELPSSAPEPFPNPTDGQNAPATNGRRQLPVPAAPAEQQEPRKPLKPLMMAMDVPAGTPIEITLETPVASDTSRVEDAVRGRVAQTVVVSGMTAIPEGSPIKGTVVAAQPSGKVKGRASIGIRFTEVVVSNTPYKIQTARIARLAETTKGEDAKKIGIGAGVGTAVGAIVGGKKGAAIGAGVGAGAGTGAVLATPGDEVQIPAGTVLKTTIDETVRITAPM